MPTPADEVAALFTVPRQPEQTDPKDAIQTISVRVPAGRLAHIDVMASHADLSRNEMCNELLRVGIAAVYAASIDPIRDELHEAVLARLELL
jgi:hypothetical protein